ncbi:hypothetical protein [Lacisediminihabitans sp.]|uniref:hypothetical protein n=1 Tax=Lacisediminihabitans sp. TaxID=2787631 RepID=UPI00374D4966
MLLADRFREVANEERGAALLAAIGLTAVAAIIAVTVTSTSLYAVGYSTSMRSGVQAQAAAEAGVDFAASSLGIPAAVCQSLYASTTEPVFSVAVSYSTLLTSPGDIDTSWVSGCPTTTAVQRLKLVSTGTASSPGVAGNSSGNTRKVEAIYQYTLTAPPWLTATGASIYSYSQTDSTVNNLTLTQAGNVLPTIQYLSGSVGCTSGSVIKGNVILGSGGASLASGCTINGDLYASGTISLQNSRVNGNVSASTGTYPSVALSNSAIVDGSVFAAGPVKIQGAVGGGIVAGPTGGGSVISNGATVGGSVVVAGTVSNGGAVTGTITQNKTGMVAPTVPYVPGWVDYPYAITDWPGFTETTISGSSCSGSGFTTAITTLLASPTPHVLNAVSCALDFTALSSVQSMKSDLVIIGNSFKLGGNDFESSDPAVDHKLWFIIPDRGVTNNHVPDCPGGGDFKMTNNVDIGVHVAALIYSPCAITNSADVWRGQIYSSSTKTANAFTLNYVPIGIPGVDFFKGTNAGETPTPPIATVGSRTSIRTLAG